MRYRLLDVMVSLALVALFFPLLALAQAATPSTGPTFRGYDLTPLIGAAVTILTGLFAWLAKKIAAAQSASAEASRAQTAQLQLAAIGLAMVGDLWNELSREFQLRIADGKIDADDRQAFRDLIQSRIEKYTSADELRKIAEALGLPLPGIIAKVAEYVIDRLTKAHDPSTPDVSAKAYPVDEPAAAFDVGSASGG
jgi:hypothetical protein